MTAVTCHGRGLDEAGPSSIFIGGGAPNCRMNNSYENILLRRGGADDHCRQRRGGWIQPNEPTPAACGGFPSREGNNTSVFIGRGELEKYMRRFYQVAYLAIRDHDWNRTASVQEEKQSLNLSFIFNRS